MQHEVKPLGTLFDGTGLVEDGFVDTGDDGEAEFNRLVDGLALDNLHHWRVRARYDIARTPFQSFGPWFTIPANGWNEADLRTSCSNIPGDMNCDCEVNLADLPPFVQALIDPAAYATAHPGCNLLNGDMQPDGVVDALDIDGFLDLIYP
jgi:hypothetical protein